MATERIALFPLEAVLFPEQTLPLHIFEPRYRLMTRRCLERHAPFGVVLEKAKEIAGVGCTARIAEVIKKYEDGRSDILTIGEKIFKIERTIDEQAYLEAEISFLTDDTKGLGESALQQLRDLYLLCHEALYGQAGPPHEGAPGSSFAYHVASELPLELPLRQSLLEERSEAARQQRLIVQLTEWLPQLKHRDRVRKKAAGNGRGVH